MKENREDSRLAVHLCIAPWRLMVPTPRCSRLHLTLNWNRYESVTTPNRSCLRQVFYFPSPPGPSRLAEKSKRTTGRLGLISRTSSNNSDDDNASKRTKPKIYYCCYSIAATFQRVSIRVHVGSTPSFSCCGCWVAAPSHGDWAVVAAAAGGIVVDVAAWK